MSVVFWKRSESLRKAAQAYLRYMPDSFPSVGHDVLTRDRYEQVCDEHLEALEEFGALPDPNDDENTCVPALCWCSSSTLTVCVSQSGW
jgi:hypothetical protein